MQSVDDSTAILAFFSKPNQAPLRLLVDISHQIHLGSLFILVFLVYAKSINLHHSWLVFWPKPFKCCVKVPCLRNFVAIAIDNFWAPS